MPGDVFPREEPRSRASHAEVAVWEALRRGLPAGWRAWHSLRLRVGNRWEGEGDFVIAAPDRGLLVLEVKGGAIELHDGRWSQNGRALERAPRQQALDFVRKLVTALRDSGVEPPPYGVACAFPDVDFSESLGPAAGDLAELVIGPRHLDWIGEALPALLERAIPDHVLPRSRGWIKALHELWGETWVASLTIADEAHDGEARTVALIDEQLALLVAAEENPRAIVTGGAGTGKTLLATALCTRAAARGQHVLYVCFTDALGRAVDQGFAAARANGAKLHAKPIRRFAGELLAARGAPIPTDPAFWESASFAAACEALPPESERPQLVVVDEAQDLAPGDWDLVSELVGDRALWILADDRQAFWRRDPIPPALAKTAVRLRLDRQLRCPAAIATLAARYCDGAAAAGSSSPSGALRVLEVEPDHVLDRAAAEIMELVRGGARPRDIAVLTLAGVTASQLMQRDQLGGQRLIKADHAEATTHVVADTFLRFKGLERPFVILVEIAAGHASQYERRMHIAMTRATARLIVIATATDLAGDPRLARLVTLQERS